MNFKAKLCLLFALAAAILLLCRPGTSGAQAASTVRFSAASYSAREGGGEAVVTAIEQHLDEVGGSFLPGNQICPWLSRIVREVPQPSR